MIPIMNAKLKAWAGHGSVAGHSVWRPSHPPPTCLSQELPLIFWSFCILCWVFGMGLTIFPKFVPGFLSGGISTGGKVASEQGTPPGQHGPGAHWLPNLLSLPHWVKRLAESELAHWTQDIPSTQGQGGGCSLCLQVYVSIFTNSL